MDKTKSMISEKKYIELQKEVQLLKEELEKLKNEFKTLKSEFIRSEIARMRPRY